MTSDKTYEDPRAITAAREARYLDYVERRHKRTYPRLYWQPHHGTNPAPPELSQAAALERMNAEHRRNWELVRRDGCCGQGCGTDGYCWPIRGICPRIEEAAMAVRFCKALMEYIGSLNTEVQPEEV